MKTDAHQPSALTYRPIRPGEEKIVADLVARTFSEFVAPHFSQEGVNEFMRFVGEAVLQQRLAAGNFILVARSDDQILGCVEVRDHSHIALLFVDKSHQRRGIAKELVERAVATCRQSNPHLTALTVNASPNAVGAYGRMGFVPTAEEKTHNGIRFVPFELEVPNQSA